MAEAAHGGWTLAIEASNPSASVGGGASGGPGVALVRGDVAHVEAIRPSGRHDDDLMPAIDRLVRSSGVLRSSIDRVAVSAGPGGFTGLRVSCVTGQMLSVAFGAAAVRVPTALAVAHATVPGTRAAVVLATKGDRGHVSVVGDGLVEASLGVLEAGALEAACEAHGVEVVVADGFASEAMRAVRRCVSPVYDARVVGRLGASLASVADAAALVPIYAREPDAVTQWRARHGRAPGDP